MIEWAQPCMSVRAQERGTRWRGSDMAKSPSGRKVQTVMHEYGKGTLHSGSKKGPVVKNREQAVAIALSEQRKANAKRK